MAAVLAIGENQRLKFGDVIKLMKRLYGVTRSTADKERSDEYGAARRMKEGTIKVPDMK